MTFFDDPFLNSLTFNAPGVLVTTAFLVVFLTRTPRRRGLTLAMIGCAISLLVSLSWILIAWIASRHDMTWLHFNPWINWPLHGLSVTQLVLWIVALDMLYRDNTEQPSSFNPGEPAA